MKVWLPEYCEKRKLYSHREHFVAFRYGGLGSHYNVEWVDQLEDAAPELLPPSESVAELRRFVLGPRLRSSDD